MIWKWRNKNHSSKVSKKWRFAGSHISKAWRPIYNLKEEMSCSTSGSAVVSPSSQAEEHLMLSVSVGTRAWVISRRPNGLVAFSHEMGLITHQTASLLSNLSSLLISIMTMHRKIRNQISKHTQILLAQVMTWRAVNKKSNFHSHK